MNKKVLQLAVPNIISNISIPLLGMVDLALLGHLQSEVYLGAVAVGTMIFNFLYWGFSFLRMGTSGFAAQAYGARQLGEVMGVLSRALLVAAIGALALIILQQPISWVAFRLLNASGEVEHWARSYFYIRIFAAPATLGLYAFTGWFIGMQNAKTPMVITLLVNIANIGLNVLFVFGLGLKSNGVAWGTLLAQYVGLTVAIILFTRYYQRIWGYWRAESMKQLKAYVKFFQVNKDIFIRTLCLIAVFTFFTSRSASTNDQVLAVNTLLMQFFMFFSFLIDGFAYAAEALTGKYVGARHPAMLRRATRLLFLWGLGLALTFTFIYGLAGSLILRLLTSQADLLALAARFLPWVAAIPMVSFASFIWDGIYIGATASKHMRNTMLLASLFVYFPAYFVLREFMGNHALWLAFLLFLAARGLLQTLWAPRALPGLLQIKQR